MYQVLLENALCFALSQTMTHHQNTHGFLSTRKHMRDLRIFVGNLGKIISKPTFFCFQKTLTSDALYEITTRRKTKNIF